MSDFSSELESVMYSRNFYIRGKINYSKSGEWQRFPDGSKNYKRKKDLFVILHDYDRGATFGDWHYPEDWYTHWNSAYGIPTVTEQENRRKEMIKKKAEQAYERSKKEWRARELWSKFYVSKYTDDHPYVIRKRIRAYYARQVRSWLLVPVRDIDYNLVTLQIIKPCGFKRIWTGTSYKKNMIWLSEPLSDDYTGIIYICEGYATGCTIYEIEGEAVICGINADNMRMVAVDLRRKFVHACIRICADDDRYGKDNTGMNAAKWIKVQTGAAITYPDFTDMDISQYPTDFNDLIILSGWEVTQRQLRLIKA